MRIIVTGSRDWPDDGSVEQALSHVIMEELVSNGNTQVTIVHGDCPTGADAIARRFAERLKARGRPIDHEPHPADWSRGNSAGFKRNEEMVNLGADACIAFLGPCRKPGHVHSTENARSHGGQHAADLALRASIPTALIERDY